ncbi:MAG TPA: 23S rRNA (pseudouridine(1915)-N(3))-methyltransferase RlmH [Candidatus Acidoferrales bacterium]|nr:23S rRNA (pseudouridine(1915)-N(3))-methyltransferase RlmH [Candidatus Acidoferrales bacterium]
MKVHLVLLGKTRRAECRGMIDDYAARIRHYAELDIVEVREESAAIRKISFAPNATVVLLDAAGKNFTTPEFSKWLQTQRDSGSRELAFLCGGATGFPDDLIKRATLKLSLSSLTMPHEFARVVLAEQIYRAFTILAGHPYSK